MRQPEVILENGTMVRTHVKLGAVAGMAINPDALARRRPDTEGYIVGVVPGHGGDVYWVAHGHGKLCAAPYGFDEFELRVTAEAAT